MSETLEKVKRLVAAGRYRVSEHGYDALREDGIIADDILGALATAKVVEDYPEAWKGPSVLALEQLRSGQSVHVVWGTSARDPDTAVLITSYIPNSDVWTPDYLSRKKK